MAVESGFQKATCRLPCRVDRPVANSLEKMFRIGDRTARTKTFAERTFSLRSGDAFVAVGARDACAIL